MDFFEAELKKLEVMLRRYYLDLSQGVFIAFYQSVMQSFFKIWKFLHWFCFSEISSNAKKNIYVSRWFAIHFHVKILARPLKFRNKITFLIKKTFWMYFFKNFCLKDKIMKNKIEPIRIDFPKEQPTVFGALSKLVRPLPESMKTAVKTSALFVFSMGLFEKVGEIAIAQKWLISAKALLWFGRFTHLVPASIMLFLAILGVSCIVLGYEIWWDFMKEVKQVVGFVDQGGTGK